MQTSVNEEGSHCKGQTYYTILVSVCCMQKSAFLCQLKIHPEIVWTLPYCYSCQLPQRQVRWLQWWLSRCPTSFSGETRLRCSREKEKEKLPNGGCLQGAMPGIVPSFDVFELATLIDHWNTGITRYHFAWLVWLLPYLVTSLLYSLWV